MEEDKLFFDKQKNIDIQMRTSTLEITKQYTKILNSLPKESLYNLDIIYANKKLETIKLLNPKGLNEPQIETIKNKKLEFGKKEIEKRIKQYYGVNIIVDSPEYIEFINNITLKEKNNSNSALNIIDKYKSELLNAYLNISNVLYIALPTHGITEIQTSHNRENQYLNEIVDGIYATSGESIYDYIARTNTGGMHGYTNGIDFPRNPFNLSQSTKEKLVLNENASVYQVDASQFEPVIDFILTESGEPNLRFGNEWISRKENLSCKEEIVTYLPYEYIQNKEITIQGKSLNEKLKTMEALSELKEIRKGLLAEKENDTNANSSSIKL